MGAGDYSLYILRCRDGTLYTGIATDVDRRIREHESGVRGARYLQVIARLRSDVPVDRASLEKAERTFAGAGECAERCCEV